MFSDEANYEEIMGLTHWMIFTDGYSIFAKDYVRDSKVFKILDDQDHITCLAVDGNKAKRELEVLLLEMFLRQVPSQSPFAGK